MASETAGATLWLSIGIKHESKRVYVMGFARTRDDCQRIAHDRRNNEGGVDAWNVFAIDCDLGDKVFGWLRRKGMSKEVADRATSDIGRAVLQCLKD